MARDCVERHSAMIYDRGGVRRIFDLSGIGSVRWGRKLDNKTSATITIESRYCVGQISNLNRIKSRRHELVIFLGNKRSWEGPIDEISWTSNGVQIVSYDVKHYLDWTPLSKEWTNEDGGGPRYMTNRFEGILEHEMTVPYQLMVTKADGAGGTIEELRTFPRWEQIDPPANVLPFVDIRHGTVLTRVITEPFQMTLGEHLDRLAESGMDFTTVGRSLIIWDSANSISRIRTLTEADFDGELDVYESGSEYAAILHVTATAQGGEEGEPVGEEDSNVLVVGTDGGEDDFYGVWTLVDTSESEEGDSTISQATLDSQAYRRRLWRRTVPVEIRVPSGVGVVLSDSLTIDHLVPGAEVPVRATWNHRPVQQMQRITELEVSEDSSGFNISVTMQPSGDAFAFEGG